MNRKRLSASVSADLIEAAEQAVAEGRADSVSAWVNEAMRRQVQHDERLHALEDFISAWEAEHGAITKAEMDRAERDARQRAVLLRGGTARKPAKAAPPGASARRAPRKSA